MFPGAGFGFNPVTKNPDWLVLGRIGYRLNGHIRFEAEGGYRHETVTSFNGFDAGDDADRFYLCHSGSTGSGDCANPKGSETAWSAMGNVIFDLLPHSRINPFIGGGAGVIGLKLHSGGIVVGGPPTIVPITPFVAVVDSSDTHFAYQGIAGVSFRATDRVNVDLTYHYTRADNISFGNASLASIDPNETGRLRGNFRDQAVTLGFRYSFASPPAPPPHRPRRLRLPARAASASPAAASAAASTAFLRGRRDYTRSTSPSISTSSPRKPRRSSKTRPSTSPTVPPPRKWSSAAPTTSGSVASTACGSSPERRSPRPPQAG